MTGDHRPLTYLYASIVCDRCGGDGRKDAVGREPRYDLPDCPNCSGGRVDVPTTAPCQCRLNFFGELMPDGRRWPPNCRDSCGGSGTGPADWAEIRSGDPVLGGTRRIPYVLVSDYGFMPIRTNRREHMPLSHAHRMTKEGTGHLTLDLSALAASGQGHRLSVNRWQP